jgi:hypothetical protein
MVGAPPKELAQCTLGTTDSKKTRQSRKLEGESTHNCSMMRDCTGLQRAGREDSLCGTTSGWMMIDYNGCRCRLYIGYGVCIRMGGGICAVRWTLRRTRIHYTTFASWRQDRQWHYTVPFLALIVLCLAISLWHNL